MPDSILQTRNITKRFPGVIALKGVSFDLHPGEIHAICGENGAGKSTLIKILAGVHPIGSYEGELRVDGAPIQFRSVRDSERAGIAVIYQELALVPEMSAAENLFLGKEPRRFGFIDWNVIYGESRRLLGQFNIDIDPAAKINELGVGRQQLVEIAKAMSRQSRVLILDEPTAALAEHEVRVLLEILRDLKRRGIACIYISHKLDEVFAIADRITVLRDGQSIVTLDAKQASKPEVIRHMVGREISAMFPRRAGRIGDTLMSVRDLSLDGALHDISFDARAGEVLGIGGLMGAGRSELLMHLFGVWGERTSGEVLLEDRPLSSNSPREALRRGLVLVSEDRKRYGLILSRSCGFNLSLSVIGQLAPSGLIDDGREFALNRDLFDSLRVKAPSLDTIVNTLSGGNQQKIVLGKALMTEPKVILLDEPTRGIDVGAKLEVYGLINKLTAAGKAVVLVSSELPELMGMSDRILMLHEGRISGEFDARSATQEQLLTAAMGQTTAGAA